MPANFNPMNPNTIPEGRMRDRAQSRYAEMVKALQSRAA
jgi:hypothetical protein